MRTRVEGRLTDLMSALGNLSKLSSELLDESETLEFFTAARELEDAVKDVVEVARGQVLRLIQERGEQIPDGKGKQFIVNGFRIEARMSRDGLDPKKIQAWLQAKGEPMEKALAEKVTYAIAPQTEQYLRDMGADETLLGAFKYDQPTWSVYRPEKVG